MRYILEYTTLSAYQLLVVRVCLDTSQLNIGILLDVYFHCTTIEHASNTRSISIAGMRFPFGSRCVSHGRAIDEFL